MLDVLSAPLVLTKLRVPAARPRAIPRARIINLLTADNSPGVVLVCAPAGYGKTTLFIEWSQSVVKQGTAVAWYALDANDNDPTSFGSYLIASLLEALGPHPELTQIAQILRSSPDLDLQRILPAAINAIVSSGRDCLLILDDYHLITSRVIHSAIAYLLEHLPANLRIAMGSRTSPPLPLPRLRARGELLEVRATDLRFTTGETAQFLSAVMHLNLSPEGITALEERTEGWVAGLQLAALSMKGRSDTDQEIFINSFSGGHRYLVEYLLEEVVNRQPEEVQLFLLATAILERMCAPLCDAVLDAVHAQAAIVDQPLRSEAILKRIEQANLFVVPLDDHAVWYRYHHLFRDFLQNHLQKALPEQSILLHHAACHWLAEHGHLREAALHAFQTRDWEYAAAFVEKHGFTLIIHSEVSLIYEWCAAFPEPVMHAHPQLCILQCWPLVFRFRQQNRRKVEECLRQAEHAIALLEDRQLAQGLTEHAGMVRSFLAMAPDPTANPRTQLAIAEAMLTSYPEADAGQFSGMLTIGYAQMALHDSPAAVEALESARQIALHGHLYFGVVESTFHLARLEHSQGQLRRAIQICQQGQADLGSLLQQPEQQLPALGSLDIALGCVLLEQDKLEEAEQYLQRGLNRIGWDPYYLMTANLALFRLSEIQGRSQEAVAYLDRLEAAWPDIAFCTRGLRVLHALRTAPEEPNALAEAASWSQEFTPDANAALPGLGPLGATEAFYIAHLAWIRAQTATGNPQVARPILERLLSLAAKNGLKTREIELSLLEAELEAAASRNEDTHQRACEAVERALSLGQPEGFLRSFDQGPALTRLLVETAHHGAYPTYVAQILAAIQREGAAVTTGSTTRKSAVQLPPLPDLEYSEPLSERELEVLGLIAQGATNQSIAEQLVITIGTVKSHINHILRKLSALNRTEAVARARALRWLE